MKMRGLSPAASSSASMTAAEARWLASTGIQGGMPAS
jgi:hypothetical protein